MPDTPSLAQRGYEAYAADLRAQGFPQDDWHALAQSQQDAWAMAADAIIDAWDNDAEDTP